VSIYESNSKDRTPEALDALKVELEVGREGGREGGREAGGNCKP